MRRLRSIQVVVLALVASCTAGCGSTLSGGDDLRPEIRRLEQRIVELQRKAAISEVEIGRLEKRLHELENQRSSGRRPAFEGADPAPPLVESGSTSRRPSVGSVPSPRVAGSARRETSTPNAESRAPAVVGSRAPAVVGSRDSAGIVEQVDPITPAAQALYDRGYTLYHQGQFLEAEASFQRFLQGFPTSELADNAEYWIGEARYSRQDYRGALAAFRQAVNRYPDGNKAPDALLKAGQCLEELGDEGGARETYREVQRRFPETATSLIAGERLAGLGSQ